LLARDLSAEYRQLPAEFDFGELRFRAFPDDFGI